MRTLQEPALVAVHQAPEAPPVAPLLLAVVDRAIAKVRPAAAVLRMETARLAAMAPQTVAANAEATPTMAVVTAARARAPAKEKVPTMTNDQSRQILEQVC